MRGVMQSTKSVVQRTGHPHDHDRADAHGNANACEHVGHLRGRSAAGNVVTTTAQQSSFLQYDRRGRLLPELLPRP
jgi:hypothetical protein